MYVVATRIVTGSLGGASVGASIGSSVGTSPETSSVGVSLFALLGPQAASIKPRTITITKRCSKRLWNFRFIVFLLLCLKSCLPIK
ncbi:MAG: hypothetical protein ACXAC5_25550 [Promethearchaeota archaeon]